MFSFFIVLYSETKYRCDTQPSQAVRKNKIRLNSVSYNSRGMAEPDALMLSENEQLSDISLNN